MRYALVLLVALTAHAAADDLILLELSSGQTIAVRMADGEVTVIGIFETVTVIEATPVNPTPNPQVTRVTYVYEKDQGGVPPGVASGLTKLNVDPDFSGVSSEFEEDTVTGDGEVPAQYVTALTEARKAGLPCLVVERGDKVEVVKAPNTEQDVLDAVKENPDAAD